MSGSSQRVSAQSIREAIRAEIVRGAYQPGDRLPPQRELAARFGATQLTVHRAMRELARDRFIDPQGARGTFVSAASPHRRRYVILQGLVPDHVEGLGALGSAIASVAEQHDDPIRTLRVMGQVRSHHDRGELERLVSQIREDRVAGVFALRSLRPLESGALFERHDLPRVGVTDARRRAKGWVQIALNPRSLYAEAFRHLGATGRKRLGILASE
jgi:DNA-binding transcriptional regulator YhcF (GntR family)